LEQPLYISSCYTEETEIADCCSTLSVVSMLIGQIVTSQGRGFPLLLRNLEPLIWRECFTGLSASPFISTAIQSGSESHFKMSF